jgi:Ca2+/H+ antiporter
VIGFVLVGAAAVIVGLALLVTAIRHQGEQRRWDDARTYVGRTAAVIEAYANRLDQAVAMAGGGS